MRHLRVCVMLGLAAAAATSAGCEFMPRQLHPNQLWKMNRQDAWDEGYFSVPDSRPEDARE